MADLSSIIIPVKNASSGEIEVQQFIVKDANLKSNIETGIAPIQENLVAKKDYVEFDKFFYNGAYYEISTQRVNANENLVIGTNCRLANSVSAQIKKQTRPFTIDTSAETLFSVDMNESYSEDDLLYVFLRLKALSNVSANSEMVVGQFSNTSLRLHAIGIAVKTSNSTDKGIVTVSTNGTLYFKGKEQLATNDVIGINIVCKLAS